MIPLEFHSLTYIYKIFLEYSDYSLIAFFAVQKQNTNNISISLTLILVFFEILQYFNPVLII